VSPPGLQRQQLTEIGGGSAIGNPSSMTSYGPVGNAPTAAMGVKKRLDSSSRIAPDAINNHQIIQGTNFAKSPGQASSHQRISTNATLPNQCKIAL